jgi:hypothetical protein
VHVLVSITRTSIGGDLAKPEPANLLIVWVTANTCDGAIAGDEVYDARVTPLGR